MITTQSITRLLSLVAVVALFTGCDRFFVVEGTIKAEPSVRMDSVLVTVDRLDAEDKLIETTRVLVFPNGGFGELLPLLSNSQTLRMRVRLRGYRTRTLYPSAIALASDRWRVEVTLRPDTSG